MCPRASQDNVLSSQRVRLYCLLSDNENTMAFMKRVTHTVFADAEQCGQTPSVRLRLIANCD